MRWSFRTDLIEPNTRKSWKEWTDTISHIFLHELRAIPSCYGMPLLLPCKCLSLSASGNFLTPPRLLQRTLIHSQTYEYICTLTSKLLCAHTPTHYTLLYTLTPAYSHRYTLTLAHSHTHHFLSACPDTFNSAEPLA